MQFELLDFFKKKNQIWTFGQNLHAKKKVLAEVAKLRKLKSGLVK
jgi:hypothetical protein